MSRFRRRGLFVEAHKDPDSQCMMVSIDGAPAVRMSKSQFEGTYVADEPEAEAKPKRRFGRDAES